MATRLRFLTASTRTLRAAPPLRAFSPALRYASSALAQGNPDIIDSLPSTADEVLAPPPPELSVGSPSSAESVPAAPLDPLGPSDGAPTDWSRSYHGLSQQPFPKEVADVLLAPIDPLDVEIKPDGLVYLPEIKYRRVLNRAFGPGGWGLAPRSETNVGPKIVSREYALVCLGRLVAIARGEQEYFDPSGIPTATEACKSNALMRCCKDLGIASELWDPRFIREFKAQYAVEIYAEHVPTKKKRKLWRRKDQPKFDYPFKE
ncbi:mitochondrial genome maintenance MGM101-domain-containing protein [Vararia minispora EC-137]|uniref:Mitochondrial genome maintenance MGM101-domain-containing protein n=1 Tax=Vararia minispora EC-137 TaxID=1314806 RepID=A0ACB8QN34_9AGAM|nr:mitochondrial genome maintenance MGM101-domain-containing protein [Vararia minispora EC-137]